MNISVGSPLLLASLFIWVCSSQAQTPAQKTNSTLAGTSWQLVNFRGSDGKTLAPDDKAKYTMSFGSDGRVSVRIDCNRGTGSWQSSGANQLRFGLLALTRAFCPPGAINDRIARDLDLVRSYSIKDGHLFLLPTADGGTYEFEPTGGTPTETFQSPVQSKGPVSFECAESGKGTDTLTATFYQTSPGMVLVKRGNIVRPAFQVLSADGAKYEGQDLMFWDARGEATVNWSGLEMKCKPVLQ